MKHMNGRKYLHFVSNGRHIEMDFGETVLKQKSWKIERLLWIGYYKNVAKKQRTRSAVSVIAAVVKQNTNFCIFGRLPKEIIKLFCSLLLTIAICILCTVKLIEMLC